LFSDLALKEQGVSILPDYACIIIDEAHNIEHVAEDHFGINISNRRIKFLLDGLHNPRTHKGLLTYTNADRAIDTVRRLAGETEVFFRHVRTWYEQTKEDTNGRCYRNFVEDNISGHLKNLASELADLTGQSEDVDEKFEITRSMDHCQALIRDLDNFLMQKETDYVYWVEADNEAGTAVRLRSAAVNVGPDVKRCLFDKYDSVVLTSATLSTDGERARSGFDFLADRIGLDDFDAVKLGSPFDYESQVTIYIEKDLPDPNEPAFTGAAARALKKYLLRTAGRAFVLFTSYAMLRQIADRLSGWLAENEIGLLQQGLEVDRTTLLKQFRTEAGCVLFGTDSFWQGVAG
jgi:ATP-dependent DNA helicase DinG